MKFTEDKLAQPFIELLGMEGYPQLHADRTIYMLDLFCKPGQ